MAHSIKQMKSSTERSKLRRERNQEWLKSHEKPCLFCGSTNNIEWHHVNPNNKKVTIKMSLNNFEKLKQEIDLCWCLCNTCHQQLHKGLVFPLPELYQGY